MHSSGMWLWEMRCSQQSCPVSGADHLKARFLYRRQRLATCLRKFFQACSTFSEFLPCLSTEPQHPQRWAIKVLFFPSGSHSSYVSLVSLLRPVRNTEEKTHTCTSCASLQLAKVPESKIICSGRQKRYQVLEHFS